jgi:hypothetical protein
LDRIRCAQTKLCANSRRAFNDIGVDFDGVLFACCEQCAVALRQRVITIT